MNPEIFKVQKASDLPHEVEKYRIVLINHDHVILKPFFVTRQGMFALEFNPTVKVSRFTTIIKATAISQKQKREFEFEQVEGFNTFCLEHGFWFAFFEVYDHNLLKK